MTEAWNRAIITNLSFPLTLTTWDNCRLIYSTNPDWSHSHLKCANLCCQKLKLIGTRDILPCLLSCDNVSCSYSWETGMGNAMMPQLCSGNLQSEGNFGWLNKYNSPLNEMAQIYPSAWKALTVVRRCRLPPFFLNESNISSIMLVVGYNFEYLAHTSGYVL